MAALAVTALVVGLSEARQHPLTMAAAKDCSKRSLGLLQGSNPSPKDMAAVPAVVRAELPQFRKASPPPLPLLTTVAKAHRLAYVQLVALPVAQEEHLSAEQVMLSTTTPDLTPLPECSAACTDCSTTQGHLHADAAAAAAPKALPMDLLVHLTHIAGSLGSSLAAVVLPRRDPA